MPRLIEVHTGSRLNHHELQGHTTRPRNSAGSSFDIQKLILVRRKFGSAKSAVVDLEFVQCLDPPVALTEIKQSR